MADASNAVIDELTSDPSNAWARDLGYRPVWAGTRSARIAIIGQAPGRRAQESGIPWDDASGVRLRSWLGVHDDEFYNPARPSRPIANRTRPDDRLYASGGSPSSETRSLASNGQKPDNPLPAL